jgi:hypothetical protein
VLSQVPPPRLPAPHGHEEGVVGRRVEDTGGGPGEVADGEASEGLGARGSTHGCGYVREEGMHGEGTRPVDVLDVVGSEL